MRIAVGQMHVSPERDANLTTIADYARRSSAEGARLLVLPEGVIARQDDDPDFVVASAESIDGHFVSRLQEISVESSIALVCSVHIARDGAVQNVFLAIDQGEIVTKYVKLHPFDAFSSRESDSVLPGGTEPDVFVLDGISFGGIICYDVRFPELSLSLALRGAEVILCPAAWLAGPLKEQHWTSAITARALDTTCYVVGCGETSKRTIGRSLVVDPLGVTIAAAGTTPTLFLVDVDPAVVARARKILPILENRRFLTPRLMP